MILIALRPIASSLLRHKAGVFILACQVALTLAIVANVIFVIAQRIELILQSSGIDEANIVIVDNHWVGPLTYEEPHLRTNADLAALRSLPSVLDVYSDASFPVAGPWSNVVGVSLKPDQKSPNALAGPYDADEHTLRSYGLRLTKGRNFEAADVQDSDVKVSSIIITEDLSRKLFPTSQALGQTVYMGAHPRTIVGIVADFAGTSYSASRYHSVLLPARYADVAGSVYIVRTHPHTRDQVQKELIEALYKTSHLRVLDRHQGAQSFGDLRTQVFAADRGIVILLSAASIVLLLATAGGIIGITTLWVDGRRRAIGMRRALGARRRDVLAYILAENFLIVLLGILCGSLMALAANISLMHYLALQSLPPLFITLTSLFVLVLGQCAALPPARRAARIAPAEAMRIVPG